jgi:hypothetical protein
MPREKTQTTIKDRDGVEHTYTCIPFPFDHSMDLKYRLLKIIVRPLADALGEILGDMQGLPQDPESGVDATNALSEIDFSKLGPILEMIPERILEAGGPKLLSEILESTVRITPGGLGDGKDQILRVGKDPLHRDTAYAGGNWLECYKACAWVLGVNYAPFSTDGSKDLGGLWTELKSAWSSILGDS